MFKLTRVASVSAAVLAAVVLGGCVYAPPPGYAYAAPGYYAPAYYAPAYYAPYGYYGGYYGGGVALSFGDRGYHRHW